MAVYDASAWLGDRTVRPTEAQLTKIAQYDPGLYGVNLALVIRHLGYFTIPLQIASAVNNATVVGIGFVARIPFKVVGVEFGVESAAGSACTAILAKAESTAPTSFSTMMNAATDVKTAAGTFQAGPVLNGAEDIDVGDVIRLSVTGTGAGAVVGSCAIVHCFRR